MYNNLIEFIKAEGLSPFNEDKIRLQGNMNSLFKTNDARAVHLRVLQKISSEFNFPSTSCIWQSFVVTNNHEEISRRKNFFAALQQTLSREVLSSCVLARNLWHPPYSLIIATENEETFLSLKQNLCPVQLILSENDIHSLASYDLVQVIDCEQFREVLERMPQSVFLSSLEDLYLERYLIMLSAWRDIILLLRNNEVSPRLRGAINLLSPLVGLLEPSARKLLTRESAQEILDSMNDSLVKELKDITIGGDTLVTLLARESLPKELQAAVNRVIRSGELPQQTVTPTIPLRIDEEELASVIQRQEAQQATTLASSIVKHAETLRVVPDYLQQISEELLLADFTQGVLKILPSVKRQMKTGTTFNMKEVRNILLDNPQPISFHLDENVRCSILTGANSGGKTTLLEHLVQLVALSQLGISVAGDITIPLFSSVYYFAKNKGSMSKGAFETLLTRLACIEPGKGTLILADEIEAVTEPGVAGKIVCTTASYFLEKECFIVIATHLGHEIQHHLPSGARIDGIEARGLTETFDLIVDHNPIIGKLAHSTPELIIERLAKTQSGEYFMHLHKSLNGWNK